MKKLIKTLKDTEQLLLDSNGLPYCKNCGLNPAEIIKEIKELEKRAYSKGVSDTKRIEKFFKPIEGEGFEDWESYKKRMGAK